MQACLPQRRRHVAFLFQFQFKDTAMRPLRPVRAYGKVVATKAGLIWDWNQTFTNHRFLHMNQATANIAKENSKANASDAFTGAIGKASIGA
jgi:hypothetical protein